MAGTFYPADPGRLARAVDLCYTHRLGPGSSPPAPAGAADAALVISPHAGYEYSGPVAAHSYLHASSLPDPDLIIVVGPNHYGLGSGVSTFGEGSWETPLGRLRVDERAANELVKAGVADFDPESQRLEHSIEVQLPFLQRIYGDKTPFLPVSLLFQDADTAGAVAEALASVMKGRRAVVVASSDLTHYEPAESAKRKDGALLDEVVKMDVGGFYSVLERLQVTSCGFGAIAVLLRLARTLGFTKAELLKYATSGETTGDNLQVVGYASVRFERR